MAGLLTTTYSGLSFVASGGTSEIPLTTAAGNAIGYLLQAHIFVDATDDEGNVVASLTQGVDYGFNSAGTSVVLTGSFASPPPGACFQVQRRTPMDSNWVDYQSGNLLTADQLNAFETWQLYVDQELADKVETLTREDVRLYSTDDLPEGESNLYYTDKRVEDVIDTKLDTTDKLPEGERNLYYTNQRVKDVIDTELADTDDLAEGNSNLYYTDERVEAFVTDSGYIKDAGVTKLIAGAGISCRLKMAVASSRLTVRQQVAVALISGGLLTQRPGPGVVGCWRLLGEHR